MTDYKTPEALSSVAQVIAALASAGYIATNEIATAVYLAHHLRKPVLIEGPAGWARPTSPARSRRACPSR